MLLALFVGTPAGFFPFRTRCVLLALGALLEMGVALGLARLDRQSGAEERADEHRRALLDLNPRQPRDLKDTAGHDAVDVGLGDVGQLAVGWENDNE